jgi:prepilin-type N-terminal cleavage/methylation domain-containing protein
MLALERQPRAERRCSAFTLIEVTLVIAILSVAAGLFAQTMIASARIDPVSEETRMAAEAARMRLEDMRALEFALVFASYNADPADDPAGAGTAPGSWFDVPGLRPPPGATAVGRVLFPTLNGALVENLVDVPLGMPHDLDGDGVVDGADHASDAIILPVRIQLEWASKSGRQGRRRLVFYDMFARL